MNKFGKTSVVIASLILPVTLLLSSMVAWHFKETNPNNVDITAGLAYLKQILGTTLIVFAVLWVTSLVSALIGLKKDASKELSKLGLVVLALVTILSVGSGIANNKAGDAEEAYRDQKATEFFQKLEENKQ